MIDAFISLLRNTISNADEFITVDKELENLNNYTLINRMRYGDAIQVGFHAGDGCRDLLLPKMIIQPFLENAFFHAFPSGMNGRIDIYMEQSEGSLCIRIEDNGIGMDQDKAESVIDHETKKEHFSGIGIHNVSERLSLLYGDDAEADIKSREGAGTVISVRLPVRRENAEKDTE